MPQNAVILSVLRIAPPSLAKAASINYKEHPILHSPALDISLLSSRSRLCNLKLQLDYSLQRSQGKKASRAQPSSHPPHPRFFARLPTQIGARHQGVSTWERLAALRRDTILIEFEFNGKIASAAAA